MRKNIETIAKYREEIGPEFPLMIDCYMSLTVAYTIQLAHNLKGLNVKWLEECLIPDDYEGWKEIKARTAGLNMLFTTGEHEYTRYGYRALLEGRCVDVLQPDISWVGGITEARRVVALASAYDIPVIPHGSGPYSYHLQIVYPNTPMAELINLSPKADRIVPIFGGLFKDECLPKNGIVELSDRPGFGLDIDFENVSLSRPYDRKN